MKKLQNTSWVLLLTIFIFSCNPDNIDPEESSTFGIRHDKTLEQYEEIATNTAPYNSAAYPDFSSVVAFSYSLNGSENHEYVATGVLVAPQWILTAGHNFFTSDEQSTPASVSGIEIYTGNNPNSPTKVYTASELVFHPTWLNDDRLFESANDLCLVKLNESITSITPASLMSGTNEGIGENIWYCGFGDYSKQPDQNPDEFSKKHAIQNVLDRKVNSISSSTSDGTNYTGGLVAFDFDSPSGLVNSLGDDFDSQDEALLGASNSSSETATEFEGTTVEGDSGGPLFLQVNGSWVVIGILSGGANEPVLDHRDSDYGDISVFTRVGTARNWIDSVVN